MVYRTSPQLGPDLDAVFDPATSDMFFDIPGQQTIMSPRLGTTEPGSDGHLYVLVQASAAIAAAAAPGTQVTITEPGFTAAAGSGGFYAPIAGVADEAYFWARKGAL